MQDFGEDMTGGAKSGEPGASEPGNGSCRALGTLPGTLPGVLPGVLPGAGVVGLVLGAWWGGLWVWMGLAILAIARMAWRGDRSVMLLAVVALAAAWGIVRSDYVAESDAAKFVQAEPRLVRVVGQVEGEATLSSPWRGAMGAFGYQRDPNTLVVLRVERIMDQRASGRLLMRLKGADSRLRGGLRIEATGWLAQIGGPMNPGEVDFRKRLARRGIVGRLSLNAPGNWKMLDETQASGSTWWPARASIGDAAEASLNLGMSDDPVRLALLQTMLLGRWRGELSAVIEAFRDVGLAHLLSISGAHLGILLGLVWLMCRLMLIRPSRSAMVVVVVLGLFLLAVPWRVPIVRAGIMAGVMCVTVWCGRRVDARNTLAWAAMLVLLWRPSELFSPGFQLSFLVVAALLQFTEPMLERVWPKAWIGGPHMTLGVRLGRWVVGYVVVSTIAFMVALPVVAYHFQIISPLAILLSVLALPVLTAMLAVGYVKILVGLVSPTLSLVMSGPLRWVSDAMLGLVGEARGWPGATIHLVGEPNAAWSAGLLVWVWAVFSGKFAGRRRAMGLTIVLMAGWTLSVQGPNVHSTSNLATINAMAVGNGSCFLVRTPGQVMMFDCGSQRYLDLGLASIGPALTRLGVRRIDTLVISHADMDHFGGMLDVADQISIGRAWVTPQFLQEARNHPHGAAAFLLTGLAQRDIPLQTVARGHVETIGDATFSILWPPRDFHPKQQNDTSLVLSLRVGKQRVLLNGDIQEQATRALLTIGDDLRAEVTDLPHHGSLVDATEDWLRAVQPTVVLQSCGPSRRRDAQWTPLLQDKLIQRYVTDRCGMIQVNLQREKPLQVRTFREAMQNVID